MQSRMGRRLAALVLRCARVTRRKWSVVTAPTESHPALGARAIGFATAASFWPCVVTSASGFDHFADLLRCGKNHIRPVAHHSCGHECRYAILRTVFAGVCFQAQIAFPKSAFLAIGGGLVLGVVCVCDGPHPRRPP